MDLSLGDGGGGSGSQRLDPYGWSALVPHADTGRSVSGCTRSGTTIFSSLSAYTDRRNRPAQVPIHGRGSGLSGFTAVSYTHLRAHETPEHLVCRLLLEK